MKPVIFDTRSVFDRGWHAASGGGQLEGLSRQQASDQALTAVLNILCPLLGPGSRLPFAPDHALFCWDGKHKTDKPRKPHTEAFQEDLWRFKTLLPKLVGGAHYTADYEADDAVATAATNVTIRRDVTCCVVSGDKDLQQLAGPQILYYCLNKKEQLTEADICARWHIHHPRQVAIALALLGDKVDGIAGVDRIGKAAVEKIFLNEVAKGADFGESIEAICCFLTDDAKLASFVDGLEATILAVDLPNIPAPEPIKLAGIEALESMHLQSANLAWARMLGRVELAKDASSLVDSSE